jgi:cation diffusion facilitator CzcD-associated flavoprotein CzcO
MRRTRRFQGHGLKIDTQGKSHSISSMLLDSHAYRCACDVPSHNYTWSFEPKLDWTGVYSGSREIYAYFDAFAEKYHLKDYIKTENQVIGAYWNNAAGGYDVRIRDLKSGQEISNHCDILINASGILNNWRWPAIPGLKDYKGTLLHTANWNENVDLAGKHVGLIGNGQVSHQCLSSLSF